MMVSEIGPASAPIPGLAPSFQSVLDSDGAVENVDFIAPNRHCFELIWLLTSPTLSQY